jgi:cysteine desulfurase
MNFDLDANATYASSQRIQGVIQECFSRLGNPSSVHRGGQRARAAIEEARRAVRELVGAPGHHDLLVFTSGATEANNTVIRAALTRPGRVVSSAIEHPCVLRPLAALERAGKAVFFATPNPHGEISVDSIAQHLTEDTALVSVMAANNETGVINDIRAIVALVRARAPKALIHTDAAQLCGKVPLSFHELGVDLLTISGHKFGALSGVGALVVRRGVSIEPLIDGGPQESKLRGGTENVLGIISMGAAASEAYGELTQREQSMRTIRDRFEAELRQAVSDVQINGEAVTRLPNTASLYIKGVRADDLLVALDREGIFVSGGSACSSGKPEPSHVLCAMGQNEERSRSTVRISFRADQPADVAPLIVSSFQKAIARIRSSQGSQSV